MTLFQRTRTMVVANLHDLFDCLEHPEQTARQGLRELERAIESATSATARSIAAQRLLEHRRDEQRHQIDHCRQRAAAFLNSGDEAAARREVARQFELSQSLTRLDATVAEAVTINEQLRTQLQTMRERHRQQRDQLTLHAARHATATAARQMAIAGASVSNHDTGLADVQRALERIDRGAVEAEVEAELYLEASARSDSTIENAERARFIDEEIAQMRSKVTT